MEPNHQNEWLHKAGEAYQNAVYFDPRTTKTVLKAVAIWLRYSKTTASESEKTLYSNTAIDLLKQTLILKPAVWKEALQTVHLFYPQRKFVERIFPSPETSPEFQNMRVEVEQWLEHLNH